MEKLRALQQAKKAQQTQSTSTDNSSKSEATNGTTSTQTQNVFSLKKGGSKANANKASVAQLRSQKDLTEMDPIPGTKVSFPDPENLMQFNVEIKPSDGLYSGATFTFVIDIPNTYPYDPPKATCITPVYHPNINDQGKVCLNILRQEWMPVLSLGSVIFGLMTLFLEPNPDDPLDIEVAKLMVSNAKQFEKNVKDSLRGGYVGGRNFPRLL
eukprot:CAMPEP_0168551260 /NCGR_PEP_ID=MMETSP0413-20121227/6075_1 /TAXON_ID=136452 /ORGANISM="Filamoeba nolandi, Strain NC-AS-23-1" /LENGTH=211 /DNA_ID=CAMNT_0008581769 /DNA_START=95 /DNA_END=730 /DNA_ORIENTATION=-